MKTKDKEKIIDALENRNKARELAKEYVSKETELLKELEKLKGFGNPCNCEDVYSIRIITEDKYPEVSTYCLECGGYIEE